MASSTSPEKKTARPLSPPPLIGQAGNLTIFITPPSTSSATPVPVPVQAPPLRWEGDPIPAAPATTKSPLSHFLSTSLAKAQYLHSSLDSYVADWFGLNHSKYQHELNDYYQTMQKPPNNELGSATKPRDNSSKTEAL